MKKIKLTLILFLTLNSLKALPETNNIIACINHIPVYSNEFNRLFRAHLKKFERQYLFDPWQSSSLNELEDRYKLIEEAKNKNILSKSQDILGYKNYFRQKSENLGSPINTYDLNSYAEENALLLQFFQKEALKNIQDNLIEKVLILEEAKKHNLQIALWETDNRLAELKNKYKNEEEFKKFLRNNNATELELKAGMEEQIMVEILKNKFAENGNFEEWLNTTKENSLIEFALLEQENKALSCQPKIITSAQITKSKNIINSTTNNKKNLFNWFESRHKPKL